jgi:hypothetical protein
MEYESLRAGFREQEETIMPTFAVRSRTIHPLEDTTVDAETREGAIDQLVKTATAAGDTIQILTVAEMPPTAPPPP